MSDDHTSGRRSHGLRRRRSWTRTGVPLPGGRGCHLSGKRSCASAQLCLASTGSGAKVGAGNRLVYIGQTRRTLRERLLALAAGVNAEQCPFNDPHTAAPHLWLLHQHDNIQLECSCAPVVDNVPVLRGTEDMLLWRHRVATGLSTEANYGRFYPGYTRPTNRWIVRGGQSSTRMPGHRVVPITEGGAVVDFAISHPPLQGDAGPLQAHWWQRVPLSAARNLPMEAAVYIVYDQGAEAAVYIGETNRLRARAVAHTSSQWPAREPWLAYLSLPQGMPKHVLRELESDLLGWYFWHAGCAPAAQYLERQREVGEAAPL